MLENAINSLKQTTIKIVKESANGSWEELEFDQPNLDFYYAQ